ncbi:hypothetical protein SAMN05192539_1011146 [Paraburkholderia diazotrophica]|uniref:Uncharacterized protein n=1 Tax=Paraburkholderia diazotrophica TaxID=667676 RepID=A0A1H6Z9R1_9BURK|nr:hypothetical protein SAMN05192539_1011146 [Paraburkholderia diazotrophica]
MRFMRVLLEQSYVNQGFSLYIIVLPGRFFVRLCAAEMECGRRGLSNAMSPALKQARALPKMRAVHHQKMLRMPTETPVWFDVPGSSTAAAPVTLLKSTVPYTSVRLDSAYSATATPV